MHIGHEMRNIQDIMTYQDREQLCEDHHTRRGIMRAAKSADILNDIISSKNEPL
jgi:hypothetical protein